MATLWRAGDGIRRSRDRRTSIGRGRSQGGEGGPETRTPTCRALSLVNGRTSRRRKSPLRTVE
eukprot:2284313-Alexandrium_andersonii.AAC.1